MTTYKIPYDEKEISFEITDSKVVIAIPEKKPPITDIAGATKNALENPIKSPPLSKLAEKKKTACIIVTDVTRACPDKIMLPLIIEEIESRIEPQNITILIAAGMHRKMTQKEKLEKFGEIVDKYTVIDHDAQNTENLEFLGTTKNGVPIFISKTAYDADLLISIGVVEPHQYAGYSGGYKTAAIGVAGDKTISKTHSRLFIEHKKTRIGNIKGNIFNDDLREIGEKIGLDFIVNVILDDQKNVINLKAGAPSETYQTLVKEARKTSEFPIQHSFDVAICGIGSPKDANLYQTSRAASYLFFLPTQVVKNGGYIILPALCPEGAGKGTGEQRFYEMLKNHSIDEILNFEDEFKAGEQRACMMAHVLKNCKVIVVGSQFPEIVLETKMIPAPTMCDAMTIVQNDLGKNLEIILIPNSFQTLPIIN